MFNTAKVFKTGFSLVEKVAYFSIPSDRQTGKRAKRTMTVNPFPCVPSLRFGSKFIVILHTVRAVIFFIIGISTVVAHILYEREKETLFTDLGYESMQDWDPASLASYRFAFNSIRTLYVFTPIIGLLRFFGGTIFDGIDGIFAFVIVIEGTYVVLGTFLWIGFVEKKRRVLFLKIWLYGMVALIGITSAILLWDLIEWPIPLQAGCAAIILFDLYSILVVGAYISEVRRVGTIPLNTTVQVFPAQSKTFA